MRKYFLSLIFFLLHFVFKLKLQLNPTKERKNLISSQRCIATPTIFPFLNTISVTQIQLSTLMHIVAHIWQVLRDLVFYYEDDDFDVVDDGKSNLDENKKTLLEKIPHTPPTTSLPCLPQHPVVVGNFSSSSLPSFYRTHHAPANSFL